MLIEHNDVFATDNRQLPGYSGTEPAATCTLKTDARIFESPRRLSPKQEAVQDEHCNELKEANIISKAPPLSNKYAACSLFPPKKDEHGTWCSSRFVTDFRRINQHTEKDTYILPLAEDLFDRTKDACVFSLFDAKSGYNQIPLDPDTRHIFQFWWKRELWCYNRLPQGAVNSSKKFQRIMDAELTKHGLNDFCVAYQDDLLVFSHSATDHTEHVRRVLDMCRACTLRLHPGKSVVGSNAINFLGFEISRYGLTPQEAKVAAIKAMKPPTNVDEVRVMAGFLNYCRCFVQHYSEVFWCINQLLKKGATFAWDTIHNDAFNHIRDVLCTPGQATRRLNPDLPILI